MSTLKKTFNFISTISCIVIIILFYICNGLLGGFYYNGITIVMILYLLLNPLVNLYRLNKRIIDSLFYYIIIVISNCYIGYIIVNCIKIWLNFNTTKNIDFFNQANEYIFNNLVFILLILLVLIILGILMKKTKTETKKDYSSFKIVIILLSALTILFKETSIIQNIFIIVHSILCVNVLVKLNTLPIKKELQKYYFIIFGIGILMCNPISIIIPIYMYIDLDKIGINI